MRRILLHLIWLFARVNSEGTERRGPQEDEALEFLHKFNEKGQIYANHWQKCEWKYETNLTEFNAQIAMEAQMKWQTFLESMSKDANKYNLDELTPDTRRQMEKIRVTQLDTKDREHLNRVLAEMADIYATSSLCSFDGHSDSCLTLDPGLQSIMAHTRDPDVLKWTWEGWHNKVGRLLRPLYTQYMQLENKFARLNGFHDYGALWREKYDTSGFEEDIDMLWDDLRPYYLHLHAYIRRQLYNQYGPDHIDLRGAIPQQYLGDMWGRYWTYIYPIVEPFKNSPSVDPTPQLLQQNYTTKKMFDLADSFYISLGLYPLPSTFWKNSVLENQDDVDMICHPTAWDMHDGKDFRIKMCTSIDFKNLQTIHHETGHTQYQMSYATKPLLYRDGANDGFHEAIGEVMSMSVSTPSHLHKVGLLPSGETDYETDINFLMYESLRSLSSVPFHLVMDKYRWGLFRGDHPNGTNWNKEFWKLSKEVIGVVPPVERNPYLDLDVTTIFHVCNNYDMIRYFVRTILQYQFADALCKQAGFNGDLHKCDIDGSKAAGRLLRSMMEMGSSQPWPEALQVLTGQRQMSTEPMKRYFKPLYEWLKRTNHDNGDCIGWDEDCS